jgi:hypothetical protein
MRHPPRPLLNATFAAAAGVLAAVAALSVVAGVAIARRADVVPDQPLGAMIDATHVPPLLTLPGDDITLRYDVVCADPGNDPDKGGSCDAGGTVFLRPGQSGPFRPIPLELDSAADEGRLYAPVPLDVARSANGFSYYAVLRNNATGATITLPAGGANAPQRSLQMVDPVTVDLSAHVFGATDKASARVAGAAWGGGLDEVGLEGGPEVQPIGATAFDVDASGAVTVLDEVKKRVLRWAGGSSSPKAVPLDISGALADMSVGSEGAIYVLESVREGGATPLLRSFDSAGRQKAMVHVAERTASKVRVGDDGPVALSYPSGQWISVVRGGTGLAAHLQAESGTPFQELPGGAGKVLVCRTGNEARFALVNPQGARRSWRIRSSTPIAEVQLAQPLGSRLVVVLRVYTDSRDEFVALVLGGKGVLAQLSLDAADWAETAPLTRFRLVGKSLYQLGSTPAGIFVDRYDLEVS